MKRLILVLSFLILLGLGVGSQIWLSKLNPTSGVSVGSGIIASLGGLRSIAAEVVWFRANKLQREGRYGELIQLASILTFLEPHSHEVWRYFASNLAYDIPVSMPNGDKWFWVYSGVKMLRDQALKWNPGDADLCYELAHLYWYKIGYKDDPAARIYREEWRKIVEDVKSRDAWEELSMSRDKMAEIERIYDISDWTNPQASAIYWAHQGLQKSKDGIKSRLEFLIAKAKVFYKESYKKEKL